MSCFRTPRGPRLAVGLVALLLTAVAVVAPAAPASAQIVPACDAGSLQAAISAGGDVRFAADCTIGLTAPLVVPAGVTSVVDAGGRWVVLDGQDLTRHLDVRGDLTLVGLRLVRGRAVGSPGTRGWDGDRGSDGPEGAIGEEGECDLLLFDWDGDGGTGEPGTPAPEGEAEAGGPGSAGGDARGGSVVVEPSGRLVLDATDVAGRVDGGRGGDGGTGGGGGDGGRGGAGGRPDMFTGFPCSGRPGRPGSGGAGSAGAAGGAAGYGGVARGGAIFNEGTVVVRNQSWVSGEARGGDAGIGGIGGPGGAGGAGGAGASSQPGNRAGAAEVGGAGGPGGDQGPSASGGTATGGAIENRGSLTVTHSTVLGTALGGGGGTLPPDAQARGGTGGAGGDGGDGGGGTPFASLNSGADGASGGAGGDGTDGGAGGTAQGGGGGGNSAGGAIANGGTVAVADASLIRGTARGGAPGTPSTGGASGRGGFGGRGGNGARGAPGNPGGAGGNAGPGGDSGIDGPSGAGTSGRPGGDARGGAISTTGRVDVQSSTVDGLAAAGAGGGGGVPGTTQVGPTSPPGRTAAGWTGPGGPGEPAIGGQKGRNGGPGGAGAIGGIARQGGRGGVGGAGGEGGTAAGGGVHTTAGAGVELRSVQLSGQALGGPGGPGTAGGAGGSGRVYGEWDIGGYGGIASNGKASTDEAQDGGMGGSGGVVSSPGPAGPGGAGGTGGTGGTGGDARGGGVHAAGPVVVLGGSFVTVAAEGGVGGAGGAGGAGGTGGSGMQGAKGATGGDGGHGDGGAFGNPLKPGGDGGIGGGGGPGSQGGAGGFGGAGGPGGAGGDGGDAEGGAVAALAPVTIRWGTLISSGRATAGAGGTAGIGGAGGAGGGGGVGGDGGDGGIGGGGINGGANASYGGPGAAAPLGFAAHGGHGGTAGRGGDGGSARGGAVINLAEGSHLDGSRVGGHATGGAGGATQSGGAGGAGGVRGSGTGGYGGSGGNAGDGGHGGGASAGAVLAVEPFLTVGGTTFLDSTVTAGAGGAGGATGCAGHGICGGAAGANHGSPPPVGGVVGIAGQPGGVGVVVHDVTVTPNTAPTVTSIDDVELDLGQVVSVPFTVGDAEDAPDALTVTTAATDPGLVGLQVIGEGEDRTLEIGSGLARQGTTEVRVSVRDRQGAEASTTFTVRVRDLLAVPVLHPAAPPTASIGDLVRMDVTISGADHPTGTLEFYVSAPDDPTCAHRTYLGGVVVSDATTTVTSPLPLVPTEWGTHRWTVTLSADARNEAASTTCGAPGTTTEVTAPIDLQVSHECDDDDLAPEATTTCRATVRQTSGHPAPGVVLDLDLDGAETVVAPSGEGFTCAAGAAPVSFRCSRATLASDASATVAYQVRAPADAPAGTTLRLSATVASDLADPVPENDSASVFIGVGTSGDGPTITVHPDDITVDAGAEAVFEAAATGWATVAWERRPAGEAAWTAVEGATSTTLRVAAHGADDQTAYRAAFRDAMDRTTWTDPAVLTVRRAPSTLSIRVTPQPLWSGDEAEITVSVAPATATGEVHLSVDGEPLTGVHHLVDGEVTVTAQLIAGPHTVTATYDGDDDVAGSETSTTFRVEGEVRILPGTASIVEGDTGTRMLRIPVHLSEPTTDPVSVAFSSELVSSFPWAQATPGVDHESVAGTLRFTAGSTEAFVEVPVHGDTIVEPNEAVVVRLRSPVGAVIDRSFFGLGAGTIVDDDALKLTPGSGSVVEGDDGTSLLRVPVRLSGPSSEEVAVSWTTVSLSSSPWAQASPGVDHVAASGTVRFAPGTTDAAVEIEVHGDTDPELDEIVFVRFHDPEGASLDLSFFGLGIGTIVDDDTAVVVPGVGTVVEGDEGVTVLEVPVHLTRAAPTTVSAIATTVPLAALPWPQAERGVDYLMAREQVAFPPGVTDIVFEVEVVGDVEVEDDEVFAVTFQNVEGGRLGGSFFGLGLGVIVDDD